MHEESDDIATHTGRTWSEWFRLLDRWGAPEQTPHDIAEHLHAAHAVDPTWAQRILESYHRTHHVPIQGGLLGGPHDITIQRTLPTDITHAEAQLLRLGSTLDPALGARPATRTTRDTRTLRYAGTDRIEITLRPTPAGTTQLRLTHGGLPTRGARETARTRWTTALDALRAGLDDREETDRGP